MTNEEMRTLLAQNGVAKEDIVRIQENFDAEKITYVVD